MKAAPMTEGVIDFQLTDENRRLTKLRIAVKAAIGDPRRCSKVINSYLAQRKKHPSWKTDKERTVLRLARLLRDFSRLESKYGPLQLS
jgi:hypothetical protein